MGRMKEIQIELENFRRENENKNLEIELTLLKSRLYDAIASELQTQLNADVIGNDNESESDDETESEKYSEYIHIIKSFINVIYFQKIIDYVTLGKILDCLNFDIEIVSKRGSESESEN